MKIKKTIFVIICLCVALLFQSCIIDEFMKLDPDEEPKVVASGSIGNTLTFDGLEITVNSISFTDYMGGLDGLFLAEDGNKWCNIVISVKNVSEDTKEFSDNYNFDLKYKETYTYNHSFADYSDFLANVDSISPLETVENKLICFKVPNEVNDNANECLTLTVSENSISAKDYAEWKLR
ncbi:MAG: DUF4352 domain-containing protein [Ruminococcus sp.]|nr:DUF4352 domain-containing protein [Candidatus Copronaster equi]